MKFWDEDYTLLSDEIVQVMATGKPWKSQPDLQGEIIILYSKSINKSVANFGWSSYKISGIIERGRSVMTRPFRHNQYFFTEVVGFPNVELPLSINKTWSINMNIDGNWGDWANSTLRIQYTVLGEGSYSLQGETLKAWNVRADASAEFGDSYNDFWFNEDYGFVKSTIKNYGGQLMTIDLIEVID